MHFVMLLSVYFPLLLIFLPSNSLLFLLSNSLPSLLLLLSLPYSYSLILVTPLPLPLFFPSQIAHMAGGSYLYNDIRNQSKHVRKVQAVSDK